MDIIAEQTDTKLLLKEMTKKKIHYLLSKHSIKDTDVYAVFKEFFKEYLQAKYEFTFEELHEELKKIYIEKSVRSRIIALIDKFAAIEYKDEEIPQEVLRHIVKEFDVLLDELIIPQKKGGLLDKLFGKKSAPVKKSASKKKSLPEKAHEAPVSVEHKPKPSAKPSTAVTHVSAKEQDVGKTHAVAKEPSHVDKKDDAPKTVPVEEKKKAPTPPAFQEAQSKPTHSWQEAAHQKPSVTPHETRWTEDNKKISLKGFSEFTEDVPLAMEADGTGGGESGNIILPAQNKTVPSTPVPNQKAQESSQSSTPLESSTPAHAGEGVDLMDLSSQLDSIIRKPNLDSMISEVQSHIENQDKKAAKGKYRELLDHYNSLEEEQKHPYYERIQQLYASLK